MIKWTWHALTVGKNPKTLENWLRCKGVKIITLKQQMCGRGTMKDGGLLKKCPKASVNLARKSILGLKWHLIQTFNIQKHWNHCNQPKITLGRKGSFDTQKDSDKNHTEWIEAGKSTAGQSAEKEKRWKEFVDGISASTSSKQTLRATKRMDGRGPQTGNNERKFSNPTKSRTRVHNGGTRKDLVSKTSREL